MASPAREPRPSAAAAPVGAGPGAAAGSGDGPGGALPAAPPALTAESVARAASSGVGWALASSLLINALSLLSSLVLARTLAPADYGAFAVGASVVGFARFLGDGGAGAVLIQRHGQEDRVDLGRVLALQGVIAVVAAALLVLLAPALRELFDAPASSLVVIGVLAGTLLIETPGAVAKVRLRRAQRFRRLQVLTAVSMLALYATQIGGLLAGYGLAALVTAQVVGSVVSTALLVSGGGIVRPVVRGALSLARSGMAYQGTLVVQATFSLAALLVVGPVLDTRELGLYTWSTVLATPLITLTQNLHHVAFPSLSRLVEHAGHRTTEAVRTTARLQMLLVPLAVGLLVGLAEPLVRLVFDERWLGAVGAARASLLGVVALVLATLLAAALEASGRPGARLRCMVISCTVGVVAAWPLSTLYGVTGAAVAVFLLVPVLDVLLLLAAAPVDLRRGVLDGVVVGTAATVLALLAAGQVTDLTGLLLAATAVGLAGLALLPVVDLPVVRLGWSVVRRR